MYVNHLSKFFACFIILMPDLHISQIVHWLITKTPNIQQRLLSGKGAVLFNMIRQTGTAFHHQSAVFCLALHHFQNVQSETLQKFK